MTLLRSDQSLAWPRQHGIRFVSVHKVGQQQEVKQQPGLNR